MILLLNNFIKHILLSLLLFKKNKKTFPIKSFITVVFNHLIRSLIVYHYIKSCLFYYRGNVLDKFSKNVGI